MTEKSNEEEGARRTKGQQGGRSHKDSEKFKNLEKKRKSQNPYIVSSPFYYTSFINLK